MSAIKRYNKREKKSPPDADTQESPMPILTLDKKGVA
jgi:hypothetical protein